MNYRSSTVSPVTSSLVTLGFPVFYSLIFIGTLNGDNQIFLMALTSQSMGTDFSHIVSDCATFALREERVAILLSFSTPPQQIPRFVLVLKDLHVKISYMIHKIKLSVFKWI